MASNHHVPLFTTQAYPHDHALSSSPSGLFPIRAPPTLDDSDTENSVKINSYKFNSTSSNSYSDSDNEFLSEGFVSGEEGFETESERTFVSYPDDETVEEGRDSDESLRSRPFVANPGEETTETLMVEGEENVEIEEYVPLADPIVEYNPNLKRPIAQLSGDFDDDDDVVGFEEEVSGKEDVVFPVVVRVPGIGVLEEKIGVPRLKILGVEEKEEDQSLSSSDSYSPVSQSETFFEENALENPVWGKNLEAGDGFLGNIGEKLSVLKEYVNIAVLSGLVDDKCSGVTEEANAKFVASDQAIVEDEGRTRTDSMIHVVEPVKSIQTGKYVNFINEEDLVVDGIKHTILTGPGVNSAGDMCEISGDLGMVSDLTNPVTEKSINLKLFETDIGTAQGDDLSAVKHSSHLDGMKVDVAKVPMDRRSSEKSEVDVDYTVSLDQCSSSDKLHGQIEPEIDLGAVLHDRMDATMVEDRDNVVESNESQTAASTKFTESSPSQEIIYTENADLPRTMEGNNLKDGSYKKCSIPENMPRSNLNPEVRLDGEDERKHVLDKVAEEKSSSLDEDADGLVCGNSNTSKQSMNKLDHGVVPASLSGAESSQYHALRFDDQLVTDSDEEVDTDGKGGGQEILDSTALAALLEAAANARSDEGSVANFSADGSKVSKVYSVEHPVGLGSSLRPLRPSPQPNNPNILTPPEPTESVDSLNGEEKKKMEKIQQIRVKFLRLVQRLGRSPQDSIASQVLYRLVLAAGRHSSQAYSIESAERMAIQHEANGKEDLDFSLNILILGKSGVGKSATLNSIFGEEKVTTSAFEPATHSVKEIVGRIDGVKIRVFDTPGLRSSPMEQAFNQKILCSIKKFIKKCPPDVVLYVDRLDTQNRYLNDLPLLKSITSSLGSSIWKNAIVTLTHSASDPPDGPTGLPLSYEMFVAQRSHVVQQSISQVVGDLRLANPVSLVENHPLSRKDRDGQILLPNGQSWRPQLLLLCYSMKILSEVSNISKSQHPFDHRKLFGFRVHSPPLSHLLSSLLQSHAHPKLSSDQGGDGADSDIELGDLSDSDQEDDEYDLLPSFRPLKNAQIAKLSSEQRKAYFDEYDYRVKLLQKKQWKEELKRLREVKKKGKSEENDYSDMGEDGDQEFGTPETIAFPLPDMALPPSFDGDNPSYRYRFLEHTSQLLTGPVLDTYSWDHDCGYDGVSLEKNLAIAGQFPGGIAVQITKDKNKFNIHLDSSFSAKHGEFGSTMAGFDIQTLGKQLAYILKGETKIKNFKMNKTAAGVSVTFLDENVITGLKIEDQLAVGRRVVLVGSTGVAKSQGDAAYGANLEVRLKEKDYPIGQDQSTFSLSLMKWRGDLALMANLQSHFSIGRSSKMAVRVGLNNKQSGQITIKTSSSEQLQIALVGILPIVISIFRNIYPGFGKNSMN